MLFFLTEQNQRATWYEHRIYSNYVILLCQAEFYQGWIKWDDEDDKNRNLKSGTLPDGKYSVDTKIEYCCRGDGFTTNELILPTDSPFVLFKAQDHCQYVKGMNVREEHFRYDTEDDDTNNQSGGSFYYCYYYN